MADLGTVSILVDVRGQPIVKDLAKDLNNVAAAEKQVSAATQKVMADFKRMQAITAMLKKTTDDTSNSFKRLSVQELQQASRNMQGFERALANTRRGMGQFGMATQQVGYQVGDFLVQVQSGTNAFVAFGQQATQLVGILPAFSRQLGLSVGTLIGISSVLGIAIPLVTAFGAFWMRSSEEVQEGANKQKQAYESVTDALENLRLERQMETSGAATTSEQTLLNEIVAVQAERRVLAAEILQLESQVNAEYSLAIAAERGRLAVKDNELRLTEQRNQLILDEINAERERAEQAERAERAVISSYEVYAATRREAEQVAEQVRLIESGLSQAAVNGALLAGLDLSNLSDAAMDVLMLATNMGIAVEAAANLRLEQGRLDRLNQNAGRGATSGRAIEFGTGPNAGKTVEEIRRLETAARRAAGGARKLKEGLDEAAKAAEQLQKQLEAPLVNAVGSISDAFGDFVARGLRDFKGFVKSILGSFQSMIAQMIAMAVKNRIMLSLGIGGITPGMAAAGQVAGLGSAGGMLGSLGIGQGIAGLAGGTGFLGGAGNAIAGLAGGGAGFFGIGANAAAAGGGFMATLGAAVPVLGAVAAVFGLLRKKTKELDSGLRITVGNMDALVETFKTVQTTRFFGLSKKVKTTVEEASAEVSDPVIKAVQDIQTQVIKAAEMFGIAESEFEDFVYKFDVSLKGLTDEQKIQKVNEELLKMGDAFASLSGHFTSMNELLTVAQERYDLEGELLRIQGDVVELRKRELENVHSLNKGLALRIQLLQAESDLQGALGAFASAISQQQGLIRTAVDALVKPLQEALNRTKTQAERSYAIFRAAADKARGEAQNIVDILVNTLRSRTIQSESVELMRYRQAQQQLANFAGGASFNEGSLRRATEGVSIDTTKFFGSFVDYARDFYKTQISLTKLAEKAEGELTDVEKQIDIAEKAYQVATGTYQEAVEFNVALNQLLTDLAVYTEVAARNQPFIDQIKAEGDRQVELLDQILVETTKQINALLGIENSIADLVGTNVSVGEALAVLGLEGKDLAGAVLALEPVVDSVGSHIAKLDLTLGGAIDRLGLTLQDLVTLDLTAGFENLDLFAPLADIDFGEQLSPIIDAVNALKELDFSGPIAEVLGSLKELDFSGPIAEVLGSIKELDFSGLENLDFAGEISSVLEGLGTEFSALDLAAEGLNLGIVGLDGTIGILQSSVSSQAESILKLDGTIINHSAIVDALSGSVLGLGTNIKDLGISADSLGISITDLGGTLTNAMSGLGSFISGLTGAIGNLAAANNALATAQEQLRIDQQVAATTASASEISKQLAELVVPDLVTVVASQYRSGFLGDKPSTATLSTGEVFSTTSGSGEQERLNAVALAQARADELNKERDVALAREAELKAQLDKLRQEVIAAGGVPSFAVGGVHSGGMRLVGEQGPELEVTGPSRIYSAQQTKSMLTGDSSETVAELRSLRRELSEFKAEQRQIGVENVKYNKKSYDLNREWDIVGLPPTRTA